MDVPDGVRDGSKVHVPLYVATNAIRAGHIPCVGDEDPEERLGVVPLEMYHDIGELGAVAAVQDDVEAAYWYRLAANQGSAGAQYSLGVMCDKGKGVPQDDVQAYMWFNLAASRSSGEARERAAKNRDRVYERLTRDQRAEGRRLAREWNEAHPRWTGVW